MQALYRRAPACMTLTFSLLRLETCGVDRGNMRRAGRGPLANAGGLLVLYLTVAVCGGLAQIAPSPLQTERLVFVSKGLGTAVNTTVVTVIDVASGVRADCRPRAFRRPPPPGRG